MKVISKFLTEYFPSHPSDTVVKNKFYPRGLNERSIYNYYMSKKRELLEWIGDRNVSFLLKLSEKQTVLIRNQKGKPIYLTSSNFDNIITGRTNVIYVSHPELTTYWIVDIDVGPNLGMNACEQTLYILKEELRLKEIDDFPTKKYEQLLTSTKGIHLIGHLNVATNIDLLREGLKNELTRIATRLNVKSKIQWTVNEKGRENNKINFDLSCMYPNALHIAKHSLTKEFLICNDVKGGLKRVQVL